MSRNSSGTYTLPPTTTDGTNPVVSGTTIQPGWANETLDDVSTALTDSLSRSGKGGMTAPLRGPDGVVGAPAFSFTAETSSGWYRSAAGVLRLAILGVYRLLVNATGLEVNGTLQVSGTTTSTGKVTASAGADVTGTLAVIDDGGTTKKVSINAPTGLAANYALDLPTALPGSTLPVTLTSGGVLATAQLVNSQQNFGTPSAATDVVIKSFLTSTTSAVGSVTANMSNAPEVETNTGTGLAWFRGDTSNVTNITGPITSVQASGDVSGATILFTIPAGYRPNAAGSTNQYMIPIRWYDSSVSYIRNGAIVVVSGASGFAYFQGIDNAGAAVNLATGDKIYFSCGAVWKAA